MAVVMNEEGARVKYGRPDLVYEMQPSALEQQEAGGNITGELLYETVCIGENGAQPCAALGLMLATEMPAVPFQDAPYDGTVGLGLEPLSFTPLFGFLSRLLHDTSGLKQQFATFFGERGGEIAFGGHSPQHLASNLSWVSVFRPEEGYWQVGIRSIRVGNRTLDACKSGVCRGILDTSCSSLRAQPLLVEQLEDLLSTASSGCIGPDLHFELDSNTTLTLRSKDYASYAPGQRCEPRISHLPVEEQFEDLIVLGLPFLQRYYTVYDVSEKSLGFGIAAAHDAQVDETTDAREQLTQAEELEFGLENDIDPLNALLLRGVAQYCSMAMFVLLVASRQKWSARFHAAKRGVQFDVSNIALVPHNERPQADDCVICLGCCEEGLSCDECWRRLPCGHNFHETCIFEWLRKSEQCPVCRRKVGLERLPSRPW